MPVDRSAAGANQGATNRLFFALWPPPAVADVLHAEATQLAVLWGGRVMRRDTLHLTLQFLGEVPATLLPGLCRQIDGLSLPSFTMEIDRFGYWSHNHLLWAGSQRMPEPAAELAASLSHALQKAEVWPITKQVRPFVPHVTLIRQVRASQPELPPLPAMRWLCGRFFLVRSTRSARGTVVYENIGEWRLR